MNTGYKTLDGEEITDTSKLIHVYGIPPLFAIFTVYHKEGIWYAHTDDATPNDILLSELVEYGVEHEYEGFIDRSGR